MDLTIGNYVRCCLERSVLPSCRPDFACSETLIMPFPKCPRLLVPGRSARNGHAVSSIAASKTLETVLEASAQVLWIVNLVMSKV